MQLKSLLKLMLLILLLAGCVSLRQSPVLPRATWTVPEVPPVVGELEYDYGWLSYHDVSDKSNTSCLVNSDKKYLSDWVSRHLHRELDMEIQLKIAADAINRVNSLK